ncbi:MAG: hypothetical protein PHF63_10770 [Herbinix sp.]|nr:hypothetical protein [Herbinix sp.]
MFAFNIIILLLFLTGVLLCLKSSQELIKNIDKKEHKLYFLYPFANWILKKTRLEKVLKRKTNVTNAIKALYITAKPELIQRLYWCNRMAMVIAIIVLFDLLSLIGQLVNNNSVILNGNYLLRPDYGEGSSEVELNVTMEQEGDVNDSDKEERSDTQEISINVEERAYSQDKIEKIFDNVFRYLESEVLGNNKSADQVYENLHFCNTIAGTSITVEWDPENYNLIQSNGTVRNLGINEEGVDTSVTVILKYREQQAKYRMPFKIMPKQYSEEERLQQDLKEQINAYAEKSAQEDYLELPQVIENYRLSWEDKNKDSGVTMFFLGIMMATFIWLFADKELAKQMKKRKEQMLFDYPEIINKFTLLVNAGMTVKQAWNKIAEDYNDRSGQRQRNKRYAYDEMLTTCNELKLGLPENIAYEQYGRRIGLIPYIKFSSLISQNLKKGNKGFTDLLMKESIVAFEERKEIAKRLGEEAGTKLLLPMMVMLIFVFLMIMIPAFWSFRV